MKRVVSKVNLTARNTKNETKYAKTHIENQYLVFITKTLQPFR